MNLFPSTADSPMVSAEWTMKFSIGRTGLTSRCSGEILKDGMAVCYLSTVSETSNPLKVHEELAGKARAWIADYQSRRGASSEPITPSTAAP